MHVLPKIVLRSRGPIIASDAIVCNAKKEILLTKRNIEPFRGKWVLPGGHVKYGETIENALQREVEEETGYKVMIEKLHGVYSNPKRDPRYHIICICFICKIVSGDAKINFEVEEIKFFSLKSLPRKMGFDHRKIIQDFINNKGKQR